MTDPDTISADYTLRPSELAATLALLVEARQFQNWTPHRRSLTPVAMMISSCAGRIFSTAFSDTIMRRALRRPLRPSSPSPWRAARR